MQRRVLPRSCCAVAGAVAFVGLTGHAAACPSPPPAVVNIPGVAYYADARHSVRDEGLFQLNRDAMAPLDGYLAQIGHMSDAFLRGDVDAGRCALAWLTAWAKAGALLGEPTSGAQARSQRRWSAAAMALSAFKAWDAASETDRAALRPYFRQLAAAVRQDAAVDNLRNNLLYWAGLAAMASARITDDASPSRWAVEICRDAVAGLTPRGSLPLEDLRGERAIDYNGFALFPLSVIAAFNQGRVGDGATAPGCSAAALRPLARYVLAQRDRTSDRFLRWAPFMGVDVALEPGALFYAYGGGFLPLLAGRIAALARAERPL